MLTEGEIQYAKKQRLKLTLTWDMLWLFCWDWVSEFFATSIFSTERQETLLTYAVTLRGSWVLGKFRNTDCKSL